MSSLCRIRLPTRPIENVYAYECYLQARQEIWRCTEETLGRAMQLIKNGLEIAGENDVLYSQMGIVFAQYINMAVSPDECYLQKAEECARKAFKLNPGSSQGQYLSGFIQWKRGHVQEGVKELKRALDNDPNNPDALMLLAYFYGFSGKAFAAWPLLKRVIGIDPLTPVNYNVCGWVNLLDGKFEDSHEAFLKMYKMEPENPIWRFFYSICLIYNNRFKDAHSVMDLILTDTPKGIFANLTSFLKHALQRDKATALASVTEELISAAKWDEQLPWEMAIAYALIDEKDKAIDWLEIATSRGWIPYPFLNHYDPFLANIRGEERFKKLMKRVKYDWEHFEV
jgi:tetratricopeptide (TPR) repeat protein